jgi:hypothetical protein
VCCLGHQRDSPEDSHLHTHRAPTRPHGVITQTTTIHTFTQGDPIECQCRVNVFWFYTVQLTEIRIWKGGTMFLQYLTHC